MKLLQEEHSVTWFDCPKDVIPVGVPKLGALRGPGGNMEHKEMMGVSTEIVLGSSRIAKTGRVV